MLKGLHVPAAALAALLLARGDAVAAAVDEPAAQAAELGGAAMNLAGVEHELRMEETRPGAETLALTARLKAGGGRINRPIGWTLRQDGRVVFSLDAAGADIAIAPGRYEVEARYGAVTVRQPLELPKRRAVDLTLILNVGGVRTLASAGSEPLPPAIAATQTLYALGAAAPEVVTASSQAGEILRVGAGQYRVESVLTPGNVTAETTVTVKPGILSAVEITHRASIVRLDVAAGQRWRLTEIGSGWTLEGASAADAVALKAGRYRLEQQGRAEDFSVDGVSGRTVSLAPGN
jgi:hypothetical protein